VPPAGTLIGIVLPPRTENVWPEILTWEMIIDEELLFETLTLLSAS
jgi:hypothetical protein